MKNTSFCQPIYHIFDKIKFLPLYVGRESIGLYISPENIYLSILKINSAKEIFLKSRIIIKTPQNIFENGIIKEKKILAEYLKNLYINNGISPRYLSLVLTRRDVITRVVNLTPMPDDMAREVLQQQVDKHIIFGGQDSVIDWLRIDKETVLLIATRKVLVQTLVSAIELSGPEVAMIEIPPLAILRLLLADNQKSYCNSNFMVIFVVPEAIDLAIMKKGELCFFRTLEQGDYNSIFREAEMAIIYWNEKFIDEPIGRILVISELAINQSFYQELSNKLGIEVVDISNNKFLSTEQHIEQQIQIEPNQTYYHFSTLGTALRQLQKKPLFKVNLMPYDKIRKSLIKKYILIGGIGLVASLIFIFMLNLIFSFSIFLCKKRLIPIEKELSKYSYIFDKFTQLKRDSDYYQKRVAELKSFINQQKSIELLSIFNDLRKFIPSEVWLESISLDNENLFKLSGYSYSQEAVYKFVNLLRYSSNFNNTVLSSIRNQRTENGDFVTFSVSCALKVNKVKK